MFLKICVCEFDPFLGIHKEWNQEWPSQPISLCRIGQVTGGLLDQFQSILGSPEGIPSDLTCNKLLFTVTY